VHCVRQTLASGPVCGASTNPQRAYIDANGHGVHFNGIFSDTLQLVIVEGS